MIEVRLNGSELMLAAYVGSRRRVASIQRGLNKNKHAEKSDWQTDIDGAAAEMAFAKYLGVYWGGENLTFKEPDVGGWQVRSTTHGNGCLIVRRNDEDDDANFVLVITRSPDFFIVGAMRCGDAKRDEFWREDAWWVPQANLQGFPERKAAA